MPVEGVRLPHAADPIAFRRIVAVVRRQRPALLHTHLVHADFHGLLAGRLARRAGAGEHEARLQPVSVSPRVRRRGPNGRQARRPAHRHLRGPGPVPRRRRRGSRSRASRSSTTGSSRGPSPRRTAGDAPRLAVVGRLDPDQGPRDAPARNRRSPCASSRASSSRSPGSGPLEDRAARAGERARAWTARCASSARFPVPPRVMERALDRRRAVARRGVRHGGARGDGARPSRRGERRGRVCPRSSRPARPACSCRRATRTRWRRRSSSWRATRSGRGRFGAAGRRRALESFSQERCTARTAELYEAALGRVRT